MIFGPYKYNSIVRVNNEIVEKCEIAGHLVHVLDTSNTHCALIDDAVKKLNSDFRGFKSLFIKINIISTLIDYNIYRYMFFQFS